MNRVVRERGALVRRPETPRESAVKVDGGSGPDEAGDAVTEAIAADELARRVRRGGAVTTHHLSADELEAWLRDGGLAQVTSTGLLVPTERAVEIAGALETP